MDYIDNLCREDDEIVANIMFEEYWYAPYISGIYPILKTRKFRLISGAQLAFFGSMMLYFNICLILTAIKLKDDPMEMFQYAHHILLVSMFVILMIIFNRYRPIIAKIHRGIATGLSDYADHIEQHRNILKKRVNKYKKTVLTLLICIFTFFLILLMVLVPLLNQYSDIYKKTDEIYDPNGLSLNLPIPLWIHLGTDTTVTLIGAFFLELITCSLSLCIAAIMDLFYLVMTMTISLELELLTISLNRLSERALHLFKLRHGNRRVNMKNMRYDVELSQCCEDCLKQNVIHHQRIIEMFYDNSTCWWMVFVIVQTIGIFIIGISGTLVMFGVGGLGTRIFVILCSFSEILNIYYNSWCAEQIVKANDALSQALYSTNWMYMNKSCACMILLMMSQAQKGLLFTCKNLMTLNFETFSKIMNAAYSLFNILHAFGEELK